MILVVTQVDYKRALKKIRAANKDIQKDAELSIKDLTKEGMYKAKATAPFDTGLTAKAIRSKYYKRADGAEGIIIAPNAHKKSFSTRGKNTKYGANFNLTKYMHSAKGISSGHFRRSRPDFMNLTREYLKKRAPVTAKGNFKNIKTKYGR